MKSFHQIPLTWSKTYQGEIHIGGDNIATGYFDMPEKTAEEFYEKDGKRWFKTGDIGQAMPDGSFKIIDRKKDLVKLQMGEYVSLGKVESVMKIHNLIENICVCAKSSESFTVAIIVPEHSTLVALSSKLISKDSSGMTFEDLCSGEYLLFCLTSCLGPKKQGFGQESTVVK